MKSTLNSSIHPRLFVRTFLIAIAAFALSIGHSFAEVVDAAYSAGTEVPVTSSGYTAAGKSIKLTLNYAPAKGTQLMVIRNTGPGFIVGNFSNLTQGQIVALNYRGVTYNFVAHYYGGHGKDLVLMWTEQSLSATAVNKLDPQLILAVKQTRGDSPFDKPTNLRPDIYKYRGRVLVNVDVLGSQEVSNQVALLGGEIVNDSSTATMLRAWVPVSQLETLAERADVKFISPFRPSVTRTFNPGH